MTQVFVYPPSLRVSEMARKAGIHRQRRAFITRNARLDPAWAQVERRTMPIAGRAINSLIQTQGVSDLYRIHLDARRDGVAFKLAFKPPTFTVKAKEAFDQEYMTQLFQLGRRMARKGYRWDTTPPHYEPATSAAGA